MKDTIIRPPQPATPHACRLLSGGDGFLDTTNRTKSSTYRTREPLGVKFICGTCGDNWEVRRLDKDFKNRWYCFERPLFDESLEEASLQPTIEYIDGRGIDSLYKFRERITNISLVSEENVDRLKRVLWTLTAVVFYFFMSPRTFFFLDQFTDNPAPDASLWISFPIGAFWLTFGIIISALLGLILWQELKRLVDWIWNG